MPPRDMTAPTRTLRVAAAAPSVRGSLPPLARAMGAMGAMLVLLAALPAAAAPFAPSGPPLPALPGMLNPRSAGRPIGRWTGMLPDPGCDAVQTLLTLSTGLQSEAGSYLLQETCLRSPGGLAPRTSQGTWRSLRNTTIFQLDVLSPGMPDQGTDAVRNFQLQSDGSLRELDAQLRSSGPRPGWRVLSRLP